MGKQRKPEPASAAAAAAAATAVAAEPSSSRSYSSLSDPNATASFAAPPPTDDGFKAMTCSPPPPVVSTATVAAKPGATTTPAAMFVSEAQSWGWVRWLMLVVLFCISSSNIMIRYFIVFLYAVPTDGLTPEQAAHESMKDDLGLTGAQYGTLTGPAFMALFAAATTLAGYVADNHNRKWAIALGLSVWSTGTAIMGFSQSFWHVLLARGVQALGQGFCPPLAYSLLASYFSTAERGVANGVLSSGVYVGYSLASLSLMLMSVIGWREACYLVGSISACLLVPLTLIIREPPRPPKPAAPAPAAAAAAVTRSNNINNNSITAAPAPEIANMDADDSGHESGNSKSYQPPLLTNNTLTSSSSNIGTISSTISSDASSDAASEANAGTKLARFPTVPSAIAQRELETGRITRSALSFAWEDTVAARSSRCGSVGVAVHTTTMKLLLLATCLRLIGGLVFGSFLPVYLKREFPDQRKEYAILNAVVVCIGGTVSAILGGRICDWWSRATSAAARDSVNELRRAIERGDADGEDAVQKLPPPLLGLPRSLSNNSRYHKRLSQSQAQRSRKATEVKSANFSLNDPLLAASSGGSDNGNNVSVKSKGGKSSRASNNTTINANAVSNGGAQVVKLTPALLERETFKLTHAANTPANAMSNAAGNSAAGNCADTAEDANGAIASRNAVNNNTLNKKQHQHGHGHGHKAHRTQSDTFGLLLIESDADDDDYYTHDNINGNTPKNSKGNKTRGGLINSVSGLTLNTTELQQQQQQQGQDQGENGVSGLSKGKHAAAMAAGAMPLPSPAPYVYTKSKGTDNGDASQGRLNFPSSASQSSTSSSERFKLHINESIYQRDLTLLMDLVPFAMVSALSCLLSAPFTLGSVMFSSSLYSTMGSLFVAYLLGESWFGPLFVIISNHANITPRVRGMAMALAVSVSGLVSSVGPLFVGVLDDYIGDMRLGIILGVMVPNVLAGIVLLILGLRLNRYRKTRYDLARQRVLYAADLPLECDSDREGQDGNGNDDDDEDDVTEQGRRVAA